jgi:hypothetical protein
MLRVVNWTTFDPNGGPNSVCQKKACRGRCQDPLMQRRTTEIAVAAGMRKHSRKPRVNASNRPFVALVVGAMNMRCARDCGT